MTGKSLTRTKKKAKVEILDPDPDDDEARLPGERPSVCGNYRGRATQCPMCFSIYLPFEQMDDGKTCIPFCETRIEESKVCYCTEGEHSGAPTPLVEVWITVYPYDAVEK